ncbi:hypothetical protein FB45DRAFT_1003432 [Roridomyces roridus]|uniref:F-box domain-containing protein n=1 Tax=Roridomyces roridus TaxID=1738132 RepID=A0AAD7BTF5_9AGAR|nr:hypothetical protein FB45DRAFT_1003432 [Roridomyces roridus]
MENITSALLLMGNSSTSDIEHHSKSLILAAEANLARIESQIQDLLRLRDRERGIIAALKQIAAPIRKLPAELLVEIFRVVAARAGKRSIPNQTSWALKPVLVLSQVCAHWRQLWNYQVNLNLKKAPSDTYLATTKTFFERSAPLLVPMLWRGQTQEASPLVQVMLDLAPRWDSLVFEASDVSQLHKLSTDALKSLISLDLKHRDEIPAHEPLKVFLGAHSLRTVRLLVPSMDEIRMPWSQLVDLTLCVWQDEPAEKILDILVQCTNLVAAQLSGFVSWSEPPDLGSTPVVQLTQLVTLKLSCDVEYNEGFISPFFARLALPALVNLDICTGLETHWSSAELTSFLRRSPNIENLVISDSHVHMTSHNVLSLFADSPNLVTLKLQCFGYDEAFESALECLTFSATSPAHSAPRLQKLVISDNTRNLDEERLTDMISSRWWTEAQLAAFPVSPPVARWVKLKICTDFEGLPEEKREYSDVFMEEIKQLKAQGLDVKIS